MPTLATCPGCGADLFVREDSTVTCDFCHNRYFARYDGESVQLAPVEIAASAQRAVASIPATGAASGPQISRGAAVYAVPSSASTRARRLGGTPVLPKPIDRANSRNQLIAGIVLLLTVCVGAYCVISLLVSNFLTP